jgi:hypothetical protein
MRTTIWRPRVCGAFPLDNRVRFNWETRAIFRAFSLIHEPQACERSASIVGIDFCPSLQFGDTARAN